MQREGTEVIQNLRDVLGSILNHHGARWRRIIASMLRNEHDAEDVIQEAVRRMLARDLSFLSEDQVRLYLSRSISNTALELYNSRKRERMKRNPAVDYVHIPTLLPGPHECMEERERSAQKDRLLSMLQNALNQIPHKQREALRLTIMEPHGLSIRDAGMNHGIPYSTLRHRSNQGIRSLRRRLGLSLARLKRNGQQLIT